jgi:16S rRNA (guanine1516-N2)-methyltransferase
MALIGVEALTPSSLKRARELAEQWNVPAGEKLPEGKGVKVVVSDLAIGLGFAENKRGKPYYVDFSTHAWKSRLLKGLPRNHIFRRAVGDRAEKLIDATAGFGQDSVMALCLGCDVIAVEKSNVVVTVLRNGITRALREDEVVRARLEKLSVVDADAVEFLRKSARADVVYIDPMFDKPKKSAKSPKEMQLLQELLAPTSAEENERLFAAAVANARDRVVVKQPLKAKALVRAPNHSYKGQSIRYDVYLTR